MVLCVTVYYAIYYWISSTAGMNRVKKGKWSVENLIITAVVCIKRTCTGRYILNSEFWKGLVTFAEWMDEEQEKKM